MAKNPNHNRTELDTAQAMKRTYDCEHDAIRVIQAADTETQISISAEDNDSVLAVAKGAFITQASGEVDSSQLRRICKYTECKLEVSPDGSTWIELMCSPMVIVDLCAAKVRVTGADGKVYGQS